MRSAADNDIIKKIGRISLRNLPTRTLKHQASLLLFNTIGSIPRELIIDSGDSAVMVGTPNSSRVDSFGELITPGGRALFIEPHPDNHARLREAAMQYDTVTVDDRGAWSKSGTQKLKLAADSNPADHKIPVENIEHDNDYRGENYTDSIEIQVEQLDRILSDHNIHPNYIEIMVNGAELEVLKGASKILRDSHPRLLVKGHARETNTGTPINRQIVELLTEYDYKTAIGAVSDETVGNTDDWDRRAGDVYAW